MSQRKKRGRAAPHVAPAVAAPAETKQPNVYRLAIVTAAVTAVLAVLSGVAHHYLTRPAPTLHERLTSTEQPPHDYQFQAHGITVSGNNRAPFEKGDGFYGRVEVCERVGMEGVMTFMSCYLTIRPDRNITISNSANRTTATYGNGDVAKICCMSVDGAGPEPLYHVQLPRSAMDRKTYARGSEVQIVLTIPDPEVGQELDAILFSPGEGVAPHLFPIRDRTRDRVFNRAFLEKHGDDPRVQALARDLTGYRAELQALEETNRGLTYAP